MKSFGLVSVVMANYNGDLYIGDAIQSVLNQTYNEFELIIIDDNSADNSLKIINKYKQYDSRIILIQNKINLGSGNSRNKGISMAKGNYITFLDSDDLWSFDKLELHLNFMVLNKAKISHSNYGYIVNDVILKKHFKVSKKLIGYNDILKRTEMSCLTTIYNCGKIGKHFMSEHRRKQDYSLWLNILKLGFKSLPFNQVTGYYRINKKEKKQNIFKKYFSHYYFLRENQGLSIIKSHIYSMSWFKNAIIRYINL